MSKNSWHKIQLHFISLQAQDCASISTYNKHNIQQVQAKMVCPHCHFPVMICSAPFISLDILANNFCFPKIEILVSAALYFLASTSPVLIFTHTSSTAPSKRFFLSYHFPIFIKWLKIQSSIIAVAIQGGSGVHPNPLSLRQNYFISWRFFRKNRKLINDQVELTNQLNTSM